MIGFQNPHLANITAVGAVTSRSARIWVRSERPGDLKITWRPQAGGPAGEKHFTVEEGSLRDNTCAVDLPGESKQAALNPLSSYRYDVERGDSAERIGEGRFETSPDSADEAPSKFSIALMSCNQPFDSEGKVREDTVQMLKAMPAVSIRTTRSWR